MNCTKAGPRIIKVFTIFFWLVYFVTMASNVFDNNVTAIPLYIYVLMNIAVGLTALALATVAVDKDLLETIKTGSDLLLSIFWHICVFFSWAANLILVFSISGGWKPPIIGINNLLAALAIPAITTLVTAFVIFFVPVLLLEWIMGIEILDKK